MVEISLAPRSIKMIRKLDNTIVRGLNFDIQFIMSALVASITVGGKALGKNFAKTKCTNIIYAVAKVLSIFEK